jgi:hypothetical protein
MQQCGGSLPQRSISLSLCLLAAVNCRPVKMVRAMPVPVQTSRSYPPQVVVASARRQRFLRRVATVVAGRIHRRSGRIHHFVGIGIDLGTTLTSISTSYKRSGWPAHLTRPVQVKNGPTLRALDDLRAYILSGPKAVRERKLWQCACSFCWPPPNVTATSVQ